MDWSQSKPNQAEHKKGNSQGSRPICSKYQGDGCLQYKIMVAKYIIAIALET